MNRFLTAAVVGTLLGSSVASANHIDTFEDGAFSFSDSGAPATSTTLSGTGLNTANTLGGQRFMTLNVSFAPGNSTASASLVITGGDDGIRYTTSNGGFFSLVYGAGGNLNANFLDIPASALDWDRIRLDFGAGSSAASVTVTLFSAEDGGQLTSTLAFAGGDTNLDFLHSSFGPGATPAFLRNIDRAGFTVNAPVAGTYLIESFNRNGSVAPQAVPEPGSLALLALGLMGVAALRRRS